MTKTPQLRLLVLALPLALMLVSCSSPGQDAGEPDALRPFTFVNALPTVSLAHDVVVAVADELGYFEDEGLSVEMIRAEGSNAVLQALAAGDGEVGVAGADTGIAAVQAGVPVKIFSAMTVSFPNFVGVLESSPIQSIEDLRGKTIGVNSLASNARFYAEGVLIDAGVDPNNESTIIAAGAAPAMISGLQSGALDAIAIHTTAYASMEQQGVEFRYLPNPRVFDDLLGVVFQASDRALEDRPDDVAGFARAMFKGVLFSAANPSAALQIAYEAYPELAPQGGGEPPVDDVQSFGAWLLTVLPSDSSTDLLGWHELESLNASALTDNEWGAIDENRFDTIQDFAITAGVITGVSPVGDFWTSDLLAAINDFDGETVLEEAQSYGK